MFFFYCCTHYFTYFANFVATHSGACFVIVTRNVNRIDQQNSGPMMHQAHDVPCAVQTAVSKNKSQWRVLAMLSKSVIDVRLSLKYDKLRVFMQFSCCFMLVFHCNKVSRVSATLQCNRLVSLQLTRIQSTAD
jgi:hypothetical protein